MPEAVIVSAVRTAIGNFGGTLRDVPAARLGAIVIKEAMCRAGVRPFRDPELLALGPVAFANDILTELEERHFQWPEDLQPVRVDEVVMGHILQAGQGQNTARQAAIYAGMPKETNAFVINKLCASGMKAVAVAAQAVRMGEAEVVVAGGMENMSGAPYLFPHGRWGARMFDRPMVDALIHDGLQDAFYNYHMGVTSENIAEVYGITRREQDEFALRSNERALAAAKNGVFAAEIVPVEIEEKIFAADEHPRETSMEALAKLPPVFREGGTVTAGNSSAISDGAAALVIMSDEKARTLGLKPKAIIRAFAAAGVDPAYMGLAVIPAVRRALRTAGLSLADIELIEVNEAFAAQALAVIRELGLAMEKTNIYGGAIALGHPIGCTGARILVTLLNGLEQNGLRLGLATLCVGGGQGMAMIIERPG